eukprot:COSAG01_NODE_51029_length_358_cov_0.799228_1_plen_23_part_01
MGLVIWRMFAQMDPIAVFPERSG